ncbi:hypothetical protein Bca4012_097641 [Brassica carinata]
MEQREKRTRSSRRRPTEPPPSELEEMRRQDPEHTPLKNKLQLLEATRRRISILAADEEQVDNLTTQRPNAIELELHSSLSRNPEKPVGLKPRNGMTTHYRGFTMIHSSVNTRVEHQDLAEGKPGGHMTLLKAEVKNLEHS